MGAEDAHECTPGFLIYDFLTDQKSSILGVWAAPGGRETFQKDGGLRTPPFWTVLGPPGAAQTPEIDDLRSVKKSYINYPSATLTRSWVNVGKHWSAMLSSLTRLCLEGFLLST